ncbi:DciA family protein [Streptomyces sp. NPDC021100]|uniref:DciA family protein n=1 Tax=Streptomyces sp. NPDC021100 TaxID=3365114 RepID=UPI0037B3175E
MNAPQPSGIDMARVALKAARENAKKNGAMARRAQPHPRRHGRRADGRDPVGLGAALEGLVAARAWDVPVEGGSVLDQWPLIAGPHLAAHVTAVHFDLESGRLDLLPDSAAWGTQIRLLAPRLLAEIRKMTTAVRQIRDLAPGTRPHRPAPTAAGLSHPEPAAPSSVSGGITPPGYRAAVAAHRAHRPQRTVDAAIAAAIERQNRSRIMHEPAEDFARALARQQQPTRRTDDSRARALERARRERAQRTVTTPDQDRPIQECTP